MCLFLLRRPVKFGVQHLPRQHFQHILNDPKHIQKSILGLGVFQFLATVAILFPLAKLIAVLVSLFVINDN